MTEQTAGAVVPTIDESVAVLRDLVAIWRTDESESDAPVLDKTITRAVGALVQAEHAVAVTEAVLVLVDAGMLVQAAPLVRLTLECAVTGAWLAVTPGSGDSSTREALAQHRRLIHDMGKVAGADVAADLDELDTSIDELADSVEARKFIDRCDSLAGGEWLYAYYRLLSAYSHGGTTLDDLYMRAVEKTEEAPLGVGFEPRAAFDNAELVLGVQAVALHMALSAWDTLAVGHPLSGKLADIADRTGMRSGIARKDDHNAGLAGV